MKYNINDPEFVKWVKENQEMIDSLQIMVVDGFLDKWIKLVGSTDRRIDKINSEVDYYHGHMWINKKRFLKKLYFMKSTITRRMKNV